MEHATPSSQAGGISAAIFPILELALSGRVADAKKLSFAQELLSGMPDAGEGVLLA
jgi:hypothetical protein